MHTERLSWVTHAGGAGRLMQIRGAFRHKNGFDYIMFLGFRGIIVSRGHLMYRIKILKVPDRRGCCVRKALLPGFGRLERYCGWFRKLPYVF